MHKIKKYKNILFVLLLFTASISMTGCNVMEQVGSFFTKVIDTSNKVFTAVKEAVKPLKEAIDKGKEAYVTVKSAIDSVKSAAKNTVTSKNNIPAADGDGMTSSSVAESPKIIPLVIDLPKKTAQKTDIGKVTSDEVKKLQIKVNAKIKEFEAKIKVAKESAAKTTGELKKVYEETVSQITAICDVLKNTKITDSKIDITSINSSLNEVDDKVKDLVGKADALTTGFSGGNSLLGYATGKPIRFVDPKDKQLEWPLWKQNTFENFTEEYSLDPNDFSTQLLYEEIVLSRRDPDVMMGRMVEILASLESVAAIEELGMKLLRGPAAVKRVTKQAVEKAKTIKMSELKLDSQMSGQGGKVFGPNTVGGVNPTKTSLDANNSLQ